jgi:hypothetical protein
MEDDLNFVPNGRRPQYFGKWKTTSIFRQMEDDPIFWEMEDNLNILADGRWLQYFGKWKTT